MLVQRIAGVSGLRPDEWIQFVGGLLVLFTPVVFSCMTMIYMR